MSRYRPPQQAGASYITAEGEKLLKAELYQLWKVERPQVTQSVSEAAAQGDRSENAEYTYGKKRLREIDRRVRYLGKRLEQFTVVDGPPEDISKVYFGATVTLRDEQDQTCHYRIVGPDEIDLQRGYISVDSPLGRALLGKSVACDIDIESPTGPRAYYILAIDYQAASAS